MSKIKKSIQRYTSLQLLRYCLKNSLRKVSYEFSNEKQVLEEFEKAKRLLKEKKVNQARFLLQRILHSNVDFNVKSKCKTFIGFIPDLLAEEFNDPLSPDALSNEPDFYMHSQVLWEAKLVSKHRVEGGNQIEAVFKYKDKDYFISGFMPEKDSAQWRPYSEFQDLKREEK